MEKTFYYFKIALIGVLFAVAGWLISQHSSALSFQIAGVFTALLGVGQFWLWPKFVPTVNCKKRYSVYTTRVDATNGVTLLPSSNMYVTFEQVSKFYNETMQCMELSGIPGPDVTFTSFSRLGLGGVWGVYSALSKSVFINTDELPGELNRNCKTDQQVLKHEFIHHLLSQTGRGEESSDHSSTTFSKCGLGVDNIR